MRIQTLIKTLAALGALSLAGAAQASIINLDSTLFSPGGSAPYGTVQWLQSGANVNFTVTLRSDMNFLITGAKTVFTFNATDVTTSDVTNILFNGSPVADFAAVAPAPQAGLGSFTLGIDCTAGHDCPNGGSHPFFDPLTFTVLNAVEGDFGFGLPASTSASFSADVVTSTGATGVIYTTGQVKKVPEPVTLGLLGMGLLGIGFARRKVKA